MNVPALIEKMLVLFFAMAAGFVPRSADGLRLGQSDLTETHVSGGTEWERAKPDPRA